MESITLTEAELQTLQAAAWDEGFIEADEIGESKEYRDEMNPYLGDDARQAIRIKYLPGEGAAVGTPHNVTDIDDFLARKNGNSPRPLEAAPAALWSLPEGVPVWESVGRASAFIKGPTPKTAEDLDRAVWTESLLLAAALLDSLPVAAAATRKKDSRPRDRSH